MPFHTQKSRNGTVLWAEFFVQVGPEYHNSALILPKIFPGEDPQTPYHI